MNVKPLLAGLIMVAAALAGCAGSDSSEAAEVGGEVPELEVTSSTGGIRGVVVDESIRPISGAKVEIRQTGDSTTTDEKGAYAFSGLPGGTYFIEASHPLYSTVQQSVDVVAGVKAPKPVNFQLLRVIVQDPYMVTVKETGFIACSLNIVGAKSEECGEGVGVPGVGRVAGNPQNRAEIQFTVDGPHLRTLIVEQHWEPSLEVSAGGGGGFDTRVALDWSCDPVCGGNTLGSAQMASPLIIRVDNEVLEAQEFDADTIFSTFTWANDNPGVMLNQEFDMFISSFYYLAAPEEWSFVAGDQPPF